jgi:HK97 family phage major capsid protein
MFIASLVALSVVALAVLVVVNVIEGAETMSSAQLTAIADKKRAEAVKISDKAKEEGREPTEEESAEIDRLFAVAEEATTLATEAKKREDRAAKVDAARADLKKPRQRASQSNANVVNDPPPDPNAHQYAVSSDMHDNLLDDPRHGWVTFNAFAAAVKAAFLQRGVDEKLKIVAAAAGNTGLTGEDGAFLTAPEFSDQVYERTIMALQILQDCDRITLTGRANIINIPYFVDHDRSSTTYRHAGVVAYRLAEGDDITVSKLKHEAREIRMHAIGALSAATQELLEDTRNFGERLMTKQGEALAEMMVEDVMLGDGVGKPLGAWHASSARVSAAKEDDQAADSVSHQNILDMMDLLWAPSESRAKWYYNRHLRSKLRVMTIPVGTGGEVSKLFERGRGGEAPDYIDGLPAQSTDHCEAPGDVNDICLGDMSQYALVTKGTMRTAMSMHLYFASRQNAFRSDIRYGGAPLWKRAATPRKGISGTTASPWVNLAERA